MEQNPNGEVKNTGQLKKAAVFIGIGFLSSFIGSVIGYSFNSIRYVGVPLWDAVLVAFLGFGFLTAQNWYLHRPFSSRAWLRILPRTILAGLAGGTLLILVKFMYLEPFGDNIAHVLAWTAEGACIGFFLAPIIPNLSKVVAICAGGIAGCVGATLMLLIPMPFSARVAVAISDSFKGILISAAFPAAEVIAGHIALLVHWGPKEQSKLLLGKRPILLGSSSECDIILSKSEGYPAVAARIGIDAGEIYYEDAGNKKRTALKHGSKIKTGNLMVEIEKK